MFNIDSQTYETIFIKTYNIINRVGSSRGQIGFTFRGMFTVTYAVAFKVRTNNW
jgi:hypothetical protein